MTTGRNPGHENRKFEKANANSDVENGDRGERTESRQSTVSRESRNSRGDSNKQGANGLPTRRVGQFSNQVMPLPPKSPSYRKDKVNQQGI